MEIPPKHPNQAFLGISVYFFVTDTLRHYLNELSLLNQPPSEEEKEDQPSSQQEDQTESQEIDQPSSQKQDLKEDQPSQEKEQKDDDIDFSESYPTSTLKDFIEAVKIYCEDISWKGLFDFYVLFVICLSFPCFFSLRFLSFSLKLK